MSEWDYGYIEGYEAGRESRNILRDRADRLEALLREAREVIGWHDEQDVGVCMLEANDELIARIDAELHGGDPTPPADDSGHSRGHSEEGDD